MSKPLSDRERRFIDAYMGEAAGNGTQAARLAGYKGSDTVLGVQAHRMLNKPHILDAIAKEREASEARAAKKAEAAAKADAEKAAHLNATRDQKLEILTAMMIDGEAHPLARLKAVDLHNKMQGEYVQKIEHSGSVSLVDLLAPRDAGASEG